MAYSAVLCVLVGVVQPAAQQALPPASRPAPQPPSRPAPKARPRPSQPPVPFPHPLITEVLYDVPNEDAGDANKDGKRSAAADEFVELVNPHDKPIRLLGYTLTDGTPLSPRDHAPTARTQVHFVFPDLELKPGEVVVVFNGYKEIVMGPCGDSRTPPISASADFAGAWVFSMKVPSQFVAFNNDGDAVVLRDPKGRPVQTIRWGDYSGTIGSDAPLAEDAPKSLGSVQRVGISRTLVPHPDMKPGELFSPGAFDLGAQLPAAPTQSAGQAPKPTANPGSTVPASAPASAQTRPAPETDRPGGGG